MQASSPELSQKGSISAYLGMFLMAMAMLMLEIVLVRIFSVTLWYHFAFVSISLALFGIAVAATFVYRFEGLFSTEKLASRLSQASLAFGVSTIAGILVHLYFPTDSGNGVVSSILALILNYLALSLPFFCGGVCICLLLTKYPGSIGKMYACDLVGGALGAILTSVLFLFTDGPGAIAAIACIGGVAALIFGFGGSSRVQNIVNALVFVLLVGIFGIHLSYDSYFDSFLRIRRLKGHEAQRPVFEDWNTYSRISVYEATEGAGGWGMSSEYKDTVHYPAYSLLIDEAAGTSILPEPKGERNLDFLRYDITNLGHALQTGGDVGIIGVGGGRDIRAALLFERDKVRAIEINQAIVHALRNKFHDFTGGLVDDPRVQIVNDEGRSYLTRSEEQFDMIQISLIDTWAATSAGAFTLSENSLYTVEAWKLFLERLRPEGLLSVSRWYFQGLPGETYRMISLAYKSLRDRGVEDPRKHILLARNVGAATGEDLVEGVGTILVSPSPISDTMLQKFYEVCKRLNFEVVLSPDRDKDKIAAAIVNPETHNQTVKEYPLDISAPTDSRPFFFFMLKLWDAITLKDVEQGGMSKNIHAMQILFLLLAVIGILSYLVIVLPMKKSKRSRRNLVTTESSVYFLSIGLGYLAIEISQMQQINLYLGHPVFGLIVVLFTFLLASGIGSLFIKTESLHTVQKIAKRLAPALIFLLLFIGCITEVVLDMTIHFSTAYRVLCSVVLLFPCAFLMGMPLPLGLETMRHTDRSALQPWYWSINGAMSVLSTVIVTIITINFGIMASYWFGLLCYLTAMICILREANRE